ncbi:MAG: hypothetical protein PHS14_19800 [Elusimicrobia bacterium]|nr:hypothetical protein [Elusimicrobiota bacterium]
MRRFTPYREESRKDYGAFAAEDLTADQLKTGALLRIADTLEDAMRWAHSFRGCAMVRAIEHLSRGVTIRHRWEVKIRIEWPWLQRLLKARKKKRAALKLVAKKAGTVRRAA